MDAAARRQRLQHQAGAAAGVQSEAVENGRLAQRALRLIADDEMAQARRRQPHRLGR